MKIRRTCILLFSFIFLFSTVQVSATTHFTDVNETTDGYKEMNFLVKRGIITANPDIAFNVNSTITRADVAVMVARAIKLPIVKKVASSPYTDVLPTDAKLPYYIADRKSVV